MISRHDSPTPALGEYHGTSRVRPRYQSGAHPRSEARIPVSLGAGLQTGSLSGGAICRGLFQQPCGGGDAFARPALVAHLRQSLGGAIGTTTNNVVTQVLRIWWPPCLVPRGQLLPKTGRHCVAGRPSCATA